MNPFRHGFRVPFDELDPAGVLFFGHLFRHAHHAYEAFVAEIGWPLSRLLEEGPALPLARAEADFLAPLGLDDRVEVEVVPEAVGKHSFTLAYRFLGEDGRLCARARTVHVAYSPDEARSVPLPAGLREALVRASSA